MLVVNYVKEIFIICSISNRRQNFRFLFAIKTVGDIVPSAILNKNIMIVKDWRTKDGKTTNKTQKQRIKHKKIIIYGVFVVAF